MGIIKKKRDCPDENPEWNHVAVLLMDYITVMCQSEKKAWNPSKATSNNDQDSGREYSLDCGVKEEEKKELYRW